MKLQRILKMKPAELAFRGRQQAYKTMDRMAPAGSELSFDPRFDKRHCDRQLKRIVDQLENGDGQSALPQLQQRLQQLMPARFFAGAGDARLAKRLTQSADTPDKVLLQQLIANADAVCRGEFDILGYGSLSFGEPVNWRLEPIAGRESPLVHWSMINPLALDQVGDSKVVWELNRHQWLLDLGQAYRMTGDERYARCFARLITDWMRCNPPGMGINWNSALEVAMRLISWCWALLLFRGAQALTPELFHSLLGWMQQHGRFVERYLSRYFSPNTHLTVEALGLFYAGTLLPELRGAAHWRALGSQILVDQMHRQVHPDGVYFEQSTRYQYYTVEIYLHFIILADRNKVAVPEDVRHGLEQMLEFLLHVRRPDGSLPQIGDTDGGWLLPLLRRQPGDFQGLFSTAALVLRNSNFAWAAGAVAAESLWLLGGRAQDDWPLLKQAPPRLESLRCFRDGGYVVMRNSWDNRAHQLIFDTGPLGCGVSGGHGHADLLSIQCSAWGENYLVDAGTYCYSADPVWRDFFRSSKAHSTVLVDGRCQAEPSGPFSWHDRPRARLRNCVSMPGYIMADAEHVAYGSLDAPLTHRRRVMFIDSGYWLIVDDLVGTGEHRIDLRYQFAALPLALEKDDWVRARGSDSALLLKAFSTSPLRIDVNRGELAPPLGWLSPNYGQRVPAPALTCTAVATLPLRLVTLIFPLKDASANVPEVAPMIAQETITGLIFGTGEKAFIRI